MNLDLLKTLIVVARCGNISKASEKLYLTPPAITKQIKALEEEYNVKIFEQKAKKRILTEDGKNLLDYAYQIVGLVEESKRSFDEDNRQMKGTLKMGVNFALGVYVLPRLIGRFSDAYPNLKIEVSLSNSGNVLKAVKSNDVNFGFVGQKENDELIAFHLFYRDKMEVVVGPKLGLNKKALGWKKLELLPYICREKGSDIRDATDQWLRERDIRLSNKIQMNNTEAIKTFLQSAKGFSLLPLSTIANDVQAGLLRVVSVPYLNLTQNYYICHYKHKNFSKPEKVFLEFLFEAVESEAHTEK